MADDQLLDKIHDLSDLELATLLCLTNNEHCIIDAEPEALEDVVQELRLISAKVFGLPHVVVDCTPTMTLDDFTTACFPDAPRADSPIRVRNDSLYSASPAFRSASVAPALQLASVIIARNLSLAPRVVQIQALELMRTKHLYTHQGRYVVPSPFLLITVLSSDAPQLTEHLNAHMFISHYHDAESGYPNLEDLDLADDASVTSVIRKPGHLLPSATPHIDRKELAQLRKLADSITMTSEIHRYLMNIVSYLRIHRFVATGISPLSTKHCIQLTKSLATLHGLDYVTPSLVALAVKKIYMHRIVIVQPEEERSTQWGSRIDDVADLLEGVDAEVVIDDVLGSVEAPL